MDFFDGWVFGKSINLRWSIQNGRYLAITYLTCYGAQNENILILDYLSFNCYCQGLRWYSRSWNSRRFSSVVLNNSLLQASLRTLFGNIKVQLFFVYNFRRLEKLSVTANFMFALVLFYYFKRMSLLFYSKERYMATYLYRKVCANF